MARSVICLSGIAAVMTVIIAVGTAIGGEASHQNAEAILEFDTVSTGQTMLVIDNHGTLGNGGEGGVNLDYTVLGGDCDPTANVYLFDGGPFVIQLSQDGSYAISHAINMSGNVDSPNAFRPVLGEGWALQAHLTGDNYDGAYSGTFVNWDSTIACEMTAYAPTGGGDSTNFVIMKYQFFSVDGNGHDNLVIGSSYDWNVPSDSGPVNEARVLTSSDGVYICGTDDPEQDPPGCQSNASRFAMETFLGWYMNTSYNQDICANDRNIYGQYAARSDSELFLIPDAEYAEFLWNRTAARQGASGWQEAADIHGVTTVVHDFPLEASDTLIFYTALATVRNGTAADLETSIEAARVWYDENLRNSCDLFNCCVGLVGNVDGDSGDNVDIGDLTALIGYLFIPPFTAPSCMAEADVDGTGFVDIGDLTALISYLFVGGIYWLSSC